MTLPGCVICTSTDSSCVSLHRLGFVDPVLPAMTRIGALKLPKEAGNLDQPQLLQQTICHDDFNKLVYCCFIGLLCSHLQTQFCLMSTFKLRLETLVRPWKKAGVFLIAEKLVDKKYRIPNLPASSRKGKGMPLIIRLHGSDLLQQMHPRKSLSLDDIGAVACEALHRQISTTARRLSAAIGRNRQRRSLRSLSLD
ncbi:hypothetical protein EJ110_NYTH35061 [Nymphaea thermarum]|nr:hypothetical protein EJ110_NYTH35061 [Nymphaea thermarum]